MLLAVAVLFFLSFNLCWYFIVFITCNELRLQVKANSKIQYCQVTCKLVIVPFFILLYSKSKVDINELKMYNHSYT